jgi:hypothetical protein
MLPIMRADVAGLAARTAGTKALTAQSIVIKRTIDEDFHNNMITRETSNTSLLYVNRNNNDNNNNQQEERRKKRKERTPENLSRSSNTSLE